MRIGIRTRVILLALISALPLVLADVCKAEEARRMALDRARQEALLLARGIATANADIINNTRHLLTGFASRVQADPGELFGARCAAGLHRLLEANSAHRNIALADGSGQLHCAAKPLDRPINVSDRPYFRVTHLPLGSLIFACQMPRGWAAVFRKCTPGTPLRLLDRLCWWNSRTVRVLSCLIGYQRALCLAGSRRRGAGPRTKTAGHSRWRLAVG